MEFDLITVFPEVFSAFLDNSIIKAAQMKGKVKVNLVNLRDYSLNTAKKIDDTVYGGGAGMLMAFPPLYRALQALRRPSSKVIYLSPQGKLLTQRTAQKLTFGEHYIIICGHYEGVDARILEFVDYEISIGDYVLTQGELASMVLLDCVIRLVDGVITPESVEDDSLQSGLLKYPEYTKPEIYEGYQVPSILLSGHHAKIAEYRLKESLRSTYLKRPDLLRKKRLGAKEQVLLAQIKDENPKK
jgi:tRNA (guanine37-N1)-methyltransferase